MYYRVPKRSRTNHHTIRCRSEMSSPIEISMIWGWPISDGYTEPGAVRSANPIAAQTVSQSAHEAAPAASLADPGLHSLCRGSFVADVRAPAGSAALGPDPDHRAQSQWCESPPPLHTPPSASPHVSVRTSPASTVARTQTSSRIPHGPRRCPSALPRLRWSQACGRRP